jgi:hypothetical protein
MQNRITDNNITSLKYGQVFCFGSNESGKHLGGAALAARNKFGAVYGNGFGMQGNSFAIPTKDWNIETLPKSVISFYVQRFIAFAKSKPELTFLVTEIGCGLAGLTPKDIAPMFSAVIELENIHLPISFWNVLTLNN